MTTKTAIYLNRCQDCGWEGANDELRHNIKYDVYTCPFCGSEDLKEFEIED